MNYKFQKFSKNPYSRCMVSSGLYYTRNRCRVMSQQSQPTVIPQYKKQKNILNNNASILQSIHRAAIARRDAAKRVFSQNFLNIRQFKTVCQQHCETV